VTFQSKQIPHVGTGSRSPERVLIATPEVEVKLMLMSLLCVAHGCHACASSASPDETGRI
jgi:hypothetical protein